MSETKKKLMTGVFILLEKKNPNLPFHPGMRAGDFIFVSGQVAKDADGNMCDGTIEEQCRSTIEAIRRVLNADGADLEDIVRISVFLEDTRDFGRYNPNLRRVFSRRSTGTDYSRSAGSN